MRTRSWGADGPTVSEIGLGCMGMSEFYGRVDAERAGDGCDRVRRAVDGPAEQNAWSPQPSPPTADQLFMDIVVGWEREESERARRVAHEHLYTPDNVYRHEWQVGDLVVWNNLSLQHGRPQLPGTGERTHRHVLGLARWHRPLGSQPSLRTPAGSRRGGWRRTGAAVTGDVSRSRTAPARPPAGTCAPSAWPARSTGGRSTAPARCGASPCTTTHTPRRPRPRCRTSASSSSSTAARVISRFVPSDAAAAPGQRVVATRAAMVPDGPMVPCFQEGEPVGRG